MTCPPRIQSDAWIIAATNRNLLESAVNGNFREDLSFRLAVVVVNTALSGSGETRLPYAKPYLHRYGVDDSNAGLTSSLGKSITPRGTMRSF